MKDNYIHPNLDPSNEGDYLELVIRLRELALDPDTDTIIISQQEYDILEDAAHPTMKDKGHTFYGKQVLVNVIY